MNAETAQIVLGGITALGAVVWLLGLQFVLATRRLMQASRRDPDSADAWSEFTAHCLAGSAEVDGQPGELSARAASVLVREALSPLGPLKVIERTDDRVRFERIGSGTAGQPAAWFRQGELWFTPLGQGRTRVEWAVELARTGWLLRLAGVFLAAGLVALSVGFWVIYTYVVSSPDPAVRWQTLQMLQVSHLLWPPFLFAALHRRGRQEVAARFEALAHNLPHFREEGG
jgi:hypothetical protein